MIRFAYESELKELKLDTIKMSALCENMIKNCIDALIRRDEAEAEAVIECDKEVDEYERIIEKKCLRLFLRQQPVAKDFREVSAVLKMITDLERIGDQASDIAQIMLSIDKDEGYIKKLVHIPMMAEKAIDMVHESMLSFIHEDLKTARKVIDDDDEVDGLFATIRGELVELIKVSTDNAEQAIYLMMIAKYLERIADHATNIAEWVIYYSTGEKPHSADSTKQRKL